VNILIDNDGHPRLTGFSQVTIVSEQRTMTPPPQAGGTIPWMSPELLYPEKFGLKKSYPTRESDCYALGMVIYEVLSGQAPFATYRDPEVVYMVLGGEHPKRPRGVEGRPFTDEVWEVLERCWKQQPGDRQNAKGVLMGLEGNLSPSWPSSGEDGGVLESDTDERSFVTESGPGTFSSLDLKLTINRRCAMIGPSVGDGDSGLMVPRPTGNPGILRVGGLLVQGFRKFFRA
jgi:serine/threonine protein kinase